MSEPISPEPTRKAEVLQVIRTVSLIGRGVDASDPAREIVQYWSLEGKLLSSHDEWKERREVRHD